MLGDHEADKSRDFICPCGKGYFSYAALFTHVKQKHDGKPPGQIIKPKPEHKRGRPRKTPLLPNAPLLPAHNQGGRVGEMEEALPPANSNQIGSNIRVITASLSLRASPGSQFKYYRADHPQEPTHHQLPVDSPPEVSLLEDITSNLVRLSPAKMPGEGLAEIEAGRLLAQGKAGELVECLSGFISFCREGLREDIASQIELLVTVLLQHVCERCKEGEGVAFLKHIHLNDHVESFFDRMMVYARRWGLEGEPIFQGLNPMKILVVLYNWINSVYGLRHAKEPTGDSKQLSPQQISPSISREVSSPSSSPSESEEDEEQGLSVSC